MNSTTRRPDHPLIGRRVFCDEAPSRVLEVVDHAPWTHPHSPIYNALVARQFITHHCSRWTGLDARGREQITPRDLDAPVVGRTVTAEFYEDDEPIADVRRAWRKGAE